MPGASGDFMKFGFKTLLPVSADTVFSFVTDPENWPLFIPGIESATPVADWGAVGGTAQAKGTFLGRPIWAEVLVVEWHASVRFRYRMRRPGRADLDSIRLFEEVAGGTQLTGETEVIPRPGLRYILDHVDAWVLDRRTGRAMRNLTQIMDDIG